MDTQKQLQQMNAGISEIKSNLDECTNERTKERLTAILDRRMVDKRELESKLSVKLQAEAEDVTDESMLTKHLRRDAMSDREKSSFIRKHGMPSYLKLAL